MVNIDEIISPQDATRIMRELTAKEVVSNWLDSQDKDYTSSAPDIILQDFFVHLMECNLINAKV